MNLENILLELIKPLVNDPDSIRVKLMDSLNDNETLLYVYVPKEDLPKLIGKQGNTANSIRQMLQLACNETKKRISIKFEEL